MGQAMNRHLIRHGYHVTANDIEPKARAAAQALGAGTVSTPAELGKVEALLSALDLAGAENNSGRRTRLKQTRLKQTLAGALISLIDGRIRIEPAPPRRRSG